MALKNVTDATEATQALTTWLAGRMPDADDVTVSGVEIPASSGLSKETVLFEALWSEGGESHHERLVARVDPPGNTVFPDADFGLEWRVLKALDDNTPVITPGMRFYEEDASILGGAFMVMTRIDGQVPSDDPPYTAGGFVMDLEPAQRGALCDNALQQMIAIHDVDWQGLGLQELAENDGVAPGLDQQFDYWRNTFDWAREGEPNPTVEAGLEWVEQNRPDDEGDPVLNWGDARIGNVIFGEDQSVRAVLDWEMVTVASRELDLGWWLFMDRHFTEGIGAPLPEGFPTREESIARYEELSGYTARDIDYYEIFAAVRLSILMHRAGNMMIAHGLLPADAPMKLNNPASNLLASLLGLPAPEGTVQSFIGNR